MIHRCPKLANVRNALLALSLLALSPLLAGNDHCASAQARPSFRTPSTATLTALELKIEARLSPSAARRGPTRRGVLIGTVAGLTAGWLIGRSVGDNFPAHLMILCAGFGAVMGLALSPRPQGS